MNEHSIEQIERMNSSNYLVNNKMLFCLLLIFLKQLNTIKHYLAFP